MITAPEHSMLKGSIQVVFQWGLCMHGHLATTVVFNHVRRDIVIEVFSDLVSSDSQRVYILPVTIYKAYLNYPIGQMAKETPFRENTKFSIAKTT